MGTVHSNAGVMNGLISCSTHFFRTVIRRNTNAIPSTDLRTAHGYHSQLKSMQQFSRPEETHFPCYPFTERTLSKGGTHKNVSSRQRRPAYELKWLQTRPTVRVCYWCSPFASCHKTLSWSSNLCIPNTHKYQHKRTWLHRMSTKSSSFLELILRALHMNISTAEFGRLKLSLLNRNVCWL
jgi:hypothetical protein